MRKWGVGSKMGRLKYSTEEQRRSAALAGVERERQRRRLVMLTQRLLVARPDLASIITTFWRARSEYLELERVIEQELWKEHILRVHLTMSSPLTTGADHGQ